MRRKGVHLLPVDSEHSAIFQCLQDAHSAKRLTKILLTASGGPFFGMKREELAGKKKEDALKHPNWNMGAKITIDSATLMNKGLELIEAVWLFGLPEDRVQIVVQRESVIHSAVQFDVADEETFRCLAACKKAIRKGGLAPCAANGANEEAVHLFLQDKIGFLDIGRLVEGVVDSEAFGGDYTLQDVWDCDAMARAYVRAHL